MCMKTLVFISARKLKDLDTFSKSDPVCRVYEQIPSTKGWKLVGNTERIVNSLNPDFKTSMTLNYFFEKVQNLKFEIVDDDGSGSYDVIGTLETTMGKIMGSRGQTFESALSHNGSTANRGTLIVRAETINESNKWV